ncbi:capsular polysaccharide export protein, LipB/KpsS family [Acetobacter sacchari]
MALGALCGLSLQRKSEGSLDFGLDSVTLGRAKTLLCDATKYRCPFSGAPITAKDAINLLEEWKAVIARNRTVAVCTGMSFWKRRRIADIFVTADITRPFPAFRRSAARAVAASRNRGVIAAWSTRISSNLSRRAARAGVSLARVEDGFIRSAGLGSGFMPPASIVVDMHGIYYDPSCPSDLERLLAMHPFGRELEARAEKLINRIVKNDISKYSYGGDSPELGAPPGRRIILVPGQVADDLSVKFGGAGIAGNIELLQYVRSDCPDAFIVYRPHPDVDAGHRLGGIPDERAMEFADIVCRDGAMAPLLSVIDEVHTLTSLAGFEALMRGKIVTTYGQPFYAGWGLTRDRAPVERRTRQLSLTQLVAATLLLYSSYIDPVTRLPCGPEVLLSRFEVASLWKPNLLMRLRRRQGSFRKAVNSGLRFSKRTLAHTGRNLLRSIDRR